VHSDPAGGMQSGADGIKLRSRAID